MNWNNNTTNYMLVFKSQKDPSWDAAFYVERASKIMAVDCIQEYLIEHLYKQGKIYIPSDLEMDYFGIFTLKGDSNWRPHLMLLGLERYP